MKEEGRVQKTVADLLALPKGKLTAKRSKTESNTTDDDTTGEEDDEYKEEVFVVPKPKESEPLKHIKLNVVLDDIWQRAHLPEKEGGVKRSKKQGFKGTKHFRRFLLTPSASDLVNWLVTKNGTTKEVAIKMCGNMKTAQYFVAFKEKDAEKPFADDSTLWIFIVSSFYGD